MLGRIVVSTYAQTITDIKKEYDIPFCTLDLFILVNHSAHEAMIPKSVLDCKAMVSIEDHNYWHYYFAFDKDTLYPGQCITKDRVIAMRYTHNQLDLFTSYAFERRLFGLDGHCLFDSEINAKWFNIRHRLLKGLVVDAQGKSPDQSPTYRHVVDVHSEQVLNRMLRAMDDFFGYRPHETHYAIQGLILAARVMQAGLNRKGRLYWDYESLITYYPRTYFKPRSDCEIYPKKEMVWQMSQSQQYIHMAVYLHQLIRRGLYKPNQDILDPDWVGYGCSGPEVLCLDIDRHLKRMNEWSLHRLVHEIEYRVVRFANGYNNLPGVLRILPDQLSFELMRGLLKTRILDQKAAWRLIDGLKHHRIPAMPIEYLRMIYEQLVNFKFGRIIGLTRFQLFLAYCMQLIPDGSIDLKIGETNHIQLMMSKSIILEHKKQFRPTVFYERQQKKHHIAMDHGKELMERIRHWFMHGS